MRRVPQRPSKKVSSVIRFPLRSARDTRPSIVAVAPSQSAILRASPGGGVEHFQRTTRDQPTTRWQVRIVYLGRLHNGTRHQSYVASSAVRPCCCPSINLHSQITLR